VITLFEAPALPGGEDYGMLVAEPPHSTPRQLDFLIAKFWSLDGRDLEGRHAVC
jgi:hypothetical protein